MLNDRGLGPLGRGDRFIPGRYSGPVEGGAVTPPTGLADGDLVTTWPDGSGNGHDATQIGSARPIFKINIVNGKPVVRYTSTGGSTMNLASLISGVGPWCIFVVMKPATPTSPLQSLIGNDGANPRGPLFGGDGNVYAVDRELGYNCSASLWTGGFHIFVADKRAVSSGFGFHIDGQFQAIGSFASPNVGDFGLLGDGDGDLAEVIFYRGLIDLTDRGNLTAGLGVEYGIAVSGGGTPVDPITVPGVKGWWKADSLL